MEEGRIADYGDMTFRITSNCCSMSNPDTRAHTSAGINSIERLGDTQCITANITIDRQPQFMQYVKCTAVRATRA